MGQQRQQQPIPRRFSSLAMIIAMNSALLITMMVLVVLSTVPLANGAAAFLHHQSSSAAAFSSSSEIRIPQHEIMSSRRSDHYRMQQHGRRYRLLSATTTRPTTSPISSVEDSTEQQQQQQEHDTTHKMRHGTPDYVGNYINVTGVQIPPLKLDNEEESTEEQLSEAAAAETTESAVVDEESSNSNDMTTRRHQGRKQTSQLQNMWKRWNTRSSVVGEGRIRRRREKLPQLSSVLEKAENAAASVAARLALSSTSSPLYSPFSSSTLSESSGSGAGAGAGAAATSSIATTTGSSSNRRYAARTLTGLISALAEEVSDLDVSVQTQDDSPLWNKQVDSIKIEFSRLSFKPLRMGGVVQANGSNNKQSSTSNNKQVAVSVDDVDVEAAAAAAAMAVSDEDNMLLTNVYCADEAFRQIDADNSGTLDRDELAMALDLATSSSSLEDERRVIRELASDLLELYDFNGDGVVDRSEYQNMVEDMAALREAQRARQAEIMARQEEELAMLSSYNGTDARPGIFARARNFVRHSLFRQGGATLPEGQQQSALDAANALVPDETEVDAAEDASQSTTTAAATATIKQKQQTPPKAKEVADDMIRQMAKTVGSITVSDLKLDLRRLLFGAIPVLKHVTPGAGGPLILEPFTVTMAGSFSRNDITHSALLDAGLRRLLGLVIRRRMRSFRDFEDLAVLFGRNWKMTSDHAPVTEVTELTSVEFDDRNRLIMTGRAKLRSRPDATTIEQAFKVRAKLGTNKDGHLIRLVEPELAFVLECPQELESSVAALCKVIGIEKPKRPEPLYTFFPIYSPFKTVEADQNDGFDLGEDNRIHNIYIQDGALHFELSAVLRPGRFLGNHYIAFTIPNRTFIVTLDRVKEGMRAARKAKKAAMARKQQKQQARAAALFRQRLLRAQREEHEQFDVVDSNVLRRYDEEGRKVNLSQKPSGDDKSDDSSNRRTYSQPKSFLGKFVDGYRQANRDQDQKRRVAAAVATIDGTKWTAPIRDFFGQQSTALLSRSGATITGVNHTQVPPTVTVAMDATDSNSTLVGTMTVPTTSSTSSSDSNAASTTSRTGEV